MCSATLCLVTILHLAGLFSIRCLPVHVGAVVGEHFYGLTAAAIILLNASIAESDVNEAAL